MRFTEALLVMLAVLLVSSNLVTAGNPATKNGGTKTTKLAPGLYAELYRVEDGVVSDKMRVPLGKVDQYSDVDFKQFGKTVKTGTEERAAVHLPKILTSGPLHFMFKGFGGFLSKFQKTRRLRIEA